MEEVYAVGVSVIQWIQDEFSEYQYFFEIVNHLSNPHFSFKYILPFISIFDAVFACQFAVCAAFGGWLNAVLKWLLSEHRPYWWVMETNYYGNASRPVLKQFPGTCETGPGCPSGHVMHTSMQLILFCMWMAHILHDRNWKITWPRCLAVPFCVSAVVCVSLARMFIATHFIQQCALGVLIGGFLSPLLCIFLIDPFVWAKNNNNYIKKRVLKHIFGALFHIVFTIGLYFANYDPNWSVRLAFKWCLDPHTIKVTTTPLFSLVESLGVLLGLSLVITPAIAKYRHYTKRRSLILATIAAFFLHLTIDSWQKSISTEHVIRFYTYQFLSYAVIPLAYIRAVPLAAALPYIWIDRNKKDK